MKRLVLLVATLGLVLCGVGKARATSLIVNGGFETGDFSGWTVNGFELVAASVSYGGEYLLPHSGSYFVFAREGTLSQTISDTVGQSYTLNMWLASDGNIPNEFKVQWNGATLYDQSNLPDTFGNAEQYNLLSFTVLGTGSDTLTLFQEDLAGVQGLDDVSLTPSTSPTPEPTTLTLAGLNALGLLGFAWWRRRKQTA
jgi:MYXO-CTERM domain-containing protein